MTASEAGKHQYRLFLLPDPLEEWRDLDGSIRQNLKKLLAKRLDNPHVPGAALHAPLSSCYKIKLTKQGVRLVYEVEGRQVDRDGAGGGPARGQRRVQGRR